MQTYTVKSVMPTGKAPHETYGTEYHVQFIEDDRPVKISRKKEPQVGDSMEGEITEGKFGLQFKKAPFNPQGSRNSTTSSTTTSTAPQSATPASSSYNSDGQRQGMCINNAANFVNNQVFDKPPTNSEWADTVYGYAQALYLKGDLKTVDEANQDPPLDMTTVKDIFGE